MPRLLVVDDHLIVREGLKRLLTGQPSGSLTAEVCSGRDAVKTLRGTAYDLVLVGVALSGISHVELLKQMRSERHDLPILIVNFTDDEHYCARLLRAGASGILMRQSGAAELADALSALFRGRRYISPSLAESLTDPPAGNGDPADVLSDREYEVMVSISSGKRIKDMADEMSLSIKTVSTYHSRILQKLRLDNDAQLVRYAIERGVIQDSATAREKLIVTDLKFKTATLAAAMREMWRLRKDVFFLIIAVSVLSYIILTYLVRFIL